MKLELNNIGKIGAAKIDINGITVIAGPNNTGKSTVGKALFAVFNSLYGLEDRMYRERFDSIRRLLDRAQPSLWIGDTIQHGVVYDLAKQIMGNRSEYKNNNAMLESLIQAKMNMGGLDYIDLPGNSLALRVQDILKISDDNLLKNMFARSLNAEFNGQISNIYSESSGEIDLVIKGKHCKVSVKDNEVVSIDRELSGELFTEAIFIDDDFTLDNLSNQKYMARYGRIYRGKLRKLLDSSNFENNLVDELVVSNKIKVMLDKIAPVCSGQVVRDKNESFGYRKKNSEKILDVRNLSSGLKPFALLKMLLEKGVIEENGTIILDEPEIHLHPEWQLLYAELIVLLQAEFGIHILLTTHSPYFLNAIETYSHKYKVDDRCNYYLTEEKDSVAYMEDVSDDRELIYRKLAEPLQTLENEEYGEC